jgi:hypothetical protein
MLEEDGSQTRALTLFVALAHVDQDRFVLPSEAECTRQKLYQAK